MCILDYSLKINLDKVVNKHMMHQKLLFQDNISDFVIKIHFRVAEKALQLFLVMCNFPL